MQVFGNRTESKCENFSKRLSDTFGFASSLSFCFCFIHELLNERRFDHDVSFSENVHEILIIIPQSRHHLTEREQIDPPDPRLWFVVTARQLHPRNQSTLFTPQVVRGKFPGGAGF